jgi:hypothetical protein
MDDAALESHVTERLAAVPGVEAISLGGSRAQGVAHDTSDWDFGVYYRGRLDTDAIRAIGWHGEVFEPGDWGGGVFNGGAWLSIDGRRVDLIYRDLDDVDRRVAEARAGRFAIERLPFYVAGIPTYVVVGELAINRWLWGEVTSPEYPDALAEAASRRWYSEATMHLDYARRAYAATADTVAAAGTLAVAVLAAAHGRLASRKEWVLTEKRLVVRAGLSDVADAFSSLGTTAAELDQACDRVEAAISGRMPSSE